MLKLFRGSRTSPYQTSLSMIGVRPGDTVVFCGASRPELAGAVGAVTGLNGQTTVVDSQDAATRVAAGAAAAGALVDFEQAPLSRLPFAADRWDAAVIVDGVLETDAKAVLAEAIRVIRPGGRLILLAATGQAGLLSRWRGSSAPPPEDTTTRLNASGLRASRYLAEVDGIQYFEAVKPRNA